MRLWMRLNGTPSKSLTEGEKIVIIQRALEEIVRDVKAGCHSAHESDSNQREALET